MLDLNTENYDLEPILSSDERKFIFDLVEKFFSTKKGSSVNEKQDFEFAEEVSNVVKKKVWETFENMNYSANWFKNNDGTTELWIRKFQEK